MNKIEKLKLALDTIKNHNITAYEIGKHTKISTFAIQKIINGETKKPNESTIDIILEFLESAIVGTDIKKNIIQEDKTEYKISPKTHLEKCLSEQIALIKRISYLEGILIKNKIDFND